MVKEIKLTHEKVALVDDDDYEMLIKRSWFAAYDKKSKMWRAQSSKRVNGVTETTLMHRLITNCPRGFVVDHINFDELDNRKCNLRVCTFNENVMHQRKSVDNTTGFKGVYDRGNFYVANLNCKNENYYLGCFKSKIAAALEYDIMAETVFGEFAHINYPKYSNNQYNPTNFNKYSNTESLLYPVRDAADLDRWMQ